MAAAAKNDWDAGVLLDAVAGDNAVTIRFYSSKLGRRVETETGERTDFEEPEINETVNPELEPGARVVEQYSGGQGFTVSYTREVWQADELKRDESYTWHYSAQDAFVELGPPAPKPTRKAPGAGTAPDEPAAPADEGGGATTEEPAAQAPTP